MERLLNYCQSIRSLGSFCIPSSVYPCIPCPGPCIRVFFGSPCHSDAQSFANSAQTQTAPLDLILGLRMPLRVPRSPIPIPIDT